MITVIVATKNSEQHLPATLQSLAAQRERMPIAEILFVDAASTDGTVRIVNDFGQGRLVRQSSKGLYAALNEGVAMAQGSHVLFLHSDDQIAAWPEKTPDLEANAVYVGTVEFVRGNGELLFARRPGWFPRWGLRQYPLVFHPNALYPAWAIRKRPYDEGRWGRKADRYQIADMAPLVRFRRFPGFVYQFRVHESSTTLQALQSGSNEPLSYWIWRVAVFLLWENRRLARVNGRMHGRRSFVAQQPVETR